MARSPKAATEQEAAATAAMLAGRGFVVWLYEHDHGADAYRELGMFIDDKFMPTRPADPRGSNRHQLR